MTDGQHRGWGRQAACGLLFAILAVVASPTTAHDGPRNHHFLMTQVAIRESVLFIDVWVERPTAAVTAEFREMFTHDPGAAAEQEQQFTRANFERMTQSLVVSLGGQVLALEFEPGPLANNGMGNEEFFVWAITAAAPIPEARKELDVRIENTLFEGEHMLLSCYVELDGGWRVAFDSAATALEHSGQEVRADRASALWTGDASVRNWELRLRR